MEKIKLETATRETMGKKVRFLRRQGIIPVHLFGHDIDSMALQCDALQLRQAMAQAGKTHIISLMLDKTKKPRNVVIREVQRDPLTDELLHVDLYQVRMDKKIQVDVPIVLIGEAPALKHKDNMLAQALHALTIECLPDRIPESAPVDVSVLTDAEQILHVKDIAIDEGVTVTNDPEQIVVKISVRRVEKVEEVVAEAVTEEEVAAAPTSEAKSTEGRAQT